MRRVVIGIVALLVLLGAGAFLVARRAEPVPRAPAVSPVPDAPARSPAAEAVQVVASGLEVPWALAFAPDGSIYVTERPGRLARIQDARVERIADIPDVAQRTEGGLLGLALDPQFATNRLLYLYFTYGDGTKNRVVRYRIADQGLADARVLVDGIPGAPFHDGGRIAFGPDGNLYITTGDAINPGSAQDLTSLAGKILRVRADGSIPDDNPFPSSPVYSYGHRNPQGLAWGADGTLYATEHGPSGPGADCCHDEVNRIEAGKNYGWSETRRSFSEGGPPSGKLGMPGLIDPIMESGPSDTWAPAGAAVVDHTLYFGGLRGQALFALDLQNPSKVHTHFRGEFGRIRDVVLGPDEFLYLTTSNRDGRGNPQPSDDRILRVDPTVLR
jgi:glucose/arabinose dehydrogenase